jgi:CRP/FNR family transcriptional regulator, cyclic AMP receptor protein
MDPSRLKRIPVFADLGDEALHALAVFAAEVSAPEGKELVREGDFSYDFMAIEEGTAKVHHGDQVIAELGPGDVFGEIGVLDKTLRSASVRATSPILLITLTSWDLRRLRNDAPKAYARLEDLVRARRAGDSAAKPD